MTLGKKNINMSILDEVHTPMLGGYQNKEEE
jgi:hypothetical protein